MLRPPPSSTCRAGHKSKRNQSPSPWGDDDDDNNNHHHHLRIYNVAYNLPNYKPGYFNDNYTVMLITAAPLLRVTGATFCNFVFLTAVLLISIELDHHPKPPN